MVDSVYKPSESEAIWNSAEIEGGKLYLVWNLKLVYIVQEERITVRK